MSSVSPRKKILITVIVVLVLAGGGLLGYTIFKNSPSYALLQVKNAVTAKDLATFNAYVDIETIISNWLDEGSESEHEEPVDDDAFDIFGGSLGDEFVNLMKPLITDYVVSTVEEYVETGELDGLEKQGATMLEDLGLISEGLSSPFQDIEFKKLQGIKKEGDNALVKALLKDSTTQKESTLQLAMHREDGVWQIVGVPDFVDFLTALSDTNEAQ